jgi:hypothetical protein
VEDLRRNGIDGPDKPVITTAILWIGQIEIALKLKLTRFVGIAPAVLWADIPKNDRKGRRCGAPWINTATAQSIFQAEKITLGTAGSPAGFL